MQENERVTSMLMKVVCMINNLMVTFSRSSCQMSNNMAVIELTME